MTLEVWLTDDAANDLEDIYSYIADHDLPRRAEHVLAKLETTIAGLVDQPKRGTHPKELLALGIREYREAFFKPYRIIYRIQDGGIYVYLISDGRRDMQTLLARRLLGA